MKLKDKLEKLKGNYLEKLDTDEKDENETPDENSLPGYELKQKLRALGNQKQINPPEGNVASEPVGVVHTQVLNEGEDDTTPIKTTVEEPPKVEDVELEICPTCGKGFKQLAKHKCKGTSFVQVDDSGKMVKSKTDKSKPKTEPKPKVEPVKIEASMGQPDSDQWVKIPTDHYKDEPTVQSTNNVSFVLFIDSIPLNKPHVSAVEMFKPVFDQVCKENKVEHWKLCDYGSGGGRVAVRAENFIQVVKETSPELLRGTYLVLNTLSPEAAPLLDVLSKHADLVVRGIR